MRIVNVPYFANTPDDKHCFQASLRMVMKYFFPHTNYSWARLEEITHKPEDKWTWPMAGLSFMKKKGLTVTQIVNLDYTRMGNEGRSYLQSIWPPYYYNNQDLNSDIDLAIVDAKKYSTLGIQIMRPPTLRDIRKFLKNGYLIICLINGGHYVLITGMTRSYIYFHNPGLPPHPNDRLDIPSFLVTWSRGNDFMAFKKN